MKNVIDPKTYLERIDIESLEKEISKRTGETIRLKTFVKGKEIVIESENLIENSGVFKAVYDSVKIGNNGNGAFVRNPKNDEIEFSTIIDIRYETKGERRNGTRLFLANYLFNSKKWIYR